MDDQTTKDLLERTKCLQRDMAALASTLSEMRGQLSAERAQWAVDMATFRASHERIRSALWGANDGSAQPGVVMRIDRIEQTELGRLRMLKWLFGLVALVIGDRLVRFFRGIP